MVVEGFSGVLSGLRAYWRRLGEAVGRGLNLCRPFRSERAAFCDTRVFVSRLVSKMC